MNRTAFLLSLAPCLSLAIVGACSSNNSESDAGAGTGPGTTIPTPDAASSADATSDAEINAPDAGDDDAMSASDARVNDGASDAGDASDAALAQDAADAADASSTPTYYVNPNTGLDTNAGTQAAPWKTLTHAIAAVGAGASTINAAPGTYNAASGETFPIQMRANVAVLGDVAHNGQGATATQIVNPLMTTSVTNSITATNGVTNFRISGFQIGVLAMSNPAAFYNVVIDNASGEFSHNSFDSNGAPAMSIGNGSVINLRDNTIQDFGGGPSVNLTISGATTVVTARNNTFVGCRAASLAGSATLAHIDFGTAASAGGNFLAPLGSSGCTGPALNVISGTGTMPVAGNSWAHSDQGSDGSGHYAASLVSGPTAGDNYVLPSGASLQF